MFGDLGGKLGYREVILARSWGQVRAFCGHIEAKLGYVGHVEAICRILFSHVVGSASQNALSKQGQDFKWVSASYVGSICESGAEIMAMLEFSGHFGPCCFCIDNRNALSPRPWRRERIKSKTTPQHKNSANTLSRMAANAKRNQNPPKSTFETLLAVALQPQRLAVKIKGLPWRSYTWWQCLLCGICQLEWRARPAPTSGVAVFLERLQAINQFNKKTATKYVFPKKLACDLRWWSGEEVKERGTGLFVSPIGGRFCAIFWCCFLASVVASVVVLLEGF